MRCKLVMIVAAFAVAACSRDTESREASDDTMAPEAEEEKAESSAPGDPSMPVAKVGDRTIAIKTAVLVEEFKGDPSERSNELRLYDADLGEAACADRWRQAQASFRVSIAARAPLEPGIRLGGDDGEYDTWIMGWNVEGTERPDRDAVSADIHIEEVVPEALDGSGSVSLRADDVTVEGPFRAKYCPTRALVRDEPEPINGMEWTMEPVDPDEIPSDPAVGFVLDTFEVAHVTARPPTSSSDERWLLTFYRREPANPCARFRTDVDEEGAAADSFELFVLESDVEDGARLAATNTRENPDERISATAVFVEPDRFRDGRLGQYRNTALAIDALDTAAGKLAGRAYIALPYDAKQLLVGGFEAEICDI
jgi:hypothetical protein